MNKVKYIGSFPPPYGGVTIKNNLIYSELEKKINIKRNRNKNRILAQVADVLSLFFWRKAFIIGISDGKGKSFWVTNVLYRFNRKALNKSLYFMMGGLGARNIAKNKLLLKQYKEYKKVYVETDSMKKILEEKGLKNVSVFPNCRKKPIVLPAVQKKNNIMKCVFFSNIQVEKGVDTILEVAKKNRNINFYLYGYIDTQYKEEFYQSVKALPNVFYKGIFIGTTEEVIDELNKYDVLLFPTRWKTEGVPGVLIEAKIAGIPAIVTDVCYNAELVKDNIEGIVIPLNSNEALESAILDLDRNQDKLERLKSGARKSAETFYIENYIEEIMGNL